MQGGVRGIRWSSGECSLPLLPASPWVEVMLHAQQSRPFPPGWAPASPGLPPCSGRFSVQPPSGPACPAGEWRAAQSSVFCQGLSPCSFLP